MYNPLKHHRRSIRLKDYDYAQPGNYFITICVQNKECLLGEIIDNEMILNDAGKMVEHWYFELAHKFSNIKCNEHIVMPNHFHCIIEIVGSDLYACSENQVRPDNQITPKNHVNPENKQTHISAPMAENSIFGEHKNSSLFSVVQWFKTMATNEYIRKVNSENWPRFNGKLFQRNYWEHIIRNKESYTTIANYIINNPKNWDNDSINPKNAKQ